MQLPAVTEHALRLLLQAIAEGKSLCVEKAAHKRRMRYTTEGAVPETVYLLCVEEFTCVGPGLQERTVTPVAELLTAQPASQFDMVATPDSVLRPAIQPARPNIIVPSDAYGVI